MRLRSKLLVGVFSSAMLILGCAPKMIPVDADDDPCLKAQGSNGFIICRDLHFLVDEQFFYVPKGFRTDLSSIPEAGLWLNATLKNKYLVSGIIHDYLYDCKSPFSRNEADNIFYNMMLSDGIEEKKARALYYLMLVVGWHYYSGDKQCHIGVEK